ncbi:MAG TPA: AAA family ATPase, partial [Candidatus Limnocylindria bacterium]|nr:AAA family ATPase [Candidatus Limnocylindria bacterium]
MYLSFYGLDEHPFNATPDPRFLFLTPSHREALAQLMYGVQENKGFIVLTGEVGTGKTTLLQTLLKRLDATTAVAYIYNSTLPFEEMLEYMLADFGIAKPGESRAQRLFALNNFLIERR